MTQTELMTTKLQWTIQVTSDFVVTRYDPEYAEIDNPEGAVARERFHLEAINDYGDRRVTGAFLTFEEAEAAIADAKPVVTWAESFPVYGSQAFIDYGEEELMEWEHRHEEWSDVFPNDRFARF